MSSSRRHLQQLQQQEEQQLLQQHQSSSSSNSGKLGSFPGALTFIFLLVAFSFVVYLRSFLALQGSLILPGSSFVESWPITVVIGANSHWTTLESVSSTPLPDQQPQQQVFIQPLFNSSSSSSDESTPDQDFILIPSRSSGEFPRSSLPPEQGEAASPGRSIEETSPAAASSGAEEEQARVEQDLQELLKIVVGSKRRQWLKQHWAEVGILQSDETSERFEKRVRGLLSRNSCSQLFFTVWISAVEAYGERETSCMESIFKHHPLACVIIVSRSLDSPQGTRLLRPFTDLGLRLMAAAPDLPYLFSGTPAQLWLRNLKKGRVDPGEISFQQNLSNILRLLVLYKFGGVYLDSDVLVLRSFAGLSNVIGAQNEDSRTGEWLRLNNAVLVFDQHHPVIHSFIKEFAHTFNGSKWGHNGPYLATRVLMRQRSSRSGLGLRFSVMRTRGFYPVDWTRMQRLFKRPESEGEWAWRRAKVKRLLNESYCIHLWNKQTRLMPVEPGSIIDELFRTECIFCGQV